MSDLCFRTSLSAKPFIYVNEFCMPFHFHKNGFALRLALKQRHNGTQKWPFIYRPGLKNIINLPPLSLKGAEVKH